MIAGKGDARRANIPYPYIWEFDCQELFSTEKKAVAPLLDFEIFYHIRRSRDMGMDVAELSW